jgi:hypothetical protein
MSVPFYLVLFARKFMKIHVIYLATARVLYIGSKDRYNPQTSFHILSQPIYLLHAVKSPFFSSKMLCMSQCYFSRKIVIFTLYIKDALKLKCPTPRPKCIIRTLYICVKKSSTALPILKLDSRMRRRLISRLRQHCPGDGVPILNA